MGMQHMVRSWASQRCLCVACLYTQGGSLQMPCFSSHAIPAGSLLALLLVDIELSSKSLVSEIRSNETLT